MSLIYLVKKKKIKKKTINGVSLVQSTRGKNGLGAPKAHCKQSIIEGAIPAGCPRSPDARGFAP